MRKLLLLSALIASACALDACTSGTASPPPPPAATHFSVSAPASASAFATVSFTVTALDASNSIVTNYSGTVKFTSSDPRATLPAPSSLTNGAATFSATFQNPGNQTIVATDAAFISGMVSISITASTKLAIASGNPPPGTVGTNYDDRRVSTPCAKGSPGCVCFFHAFPPPGHLVCIRVSGSLGFTLTAINGVQPVIWSWTADAGSVLPPGLTLQSSTITGVPTTAGTYNVVVTVKDSSSPPATASATYTITINPAQAANAAALSKSASPQQHHHYKLVDLGTFGGPNSYFNTLLVTDGFGYGTAFYGNAQVSNGQGNFVGFADTASPDPYSANPLFCYVPECYAAHAFEWKEGDKADLGTLPGGASSAAFWINSKGLIAGNSQNGEFDPVIPGLPELRAVIWKDGKIRDLGTLGGSSSFSQAVNNRGQVTGLALNDVPDAFSFYYQFLYCLPPTLMICPANATQTRGFVWDEENGMQDIGTLGGPDAFPSLINQHGQIAGFSYTDSTPQPTNGGFPTLHPFLWEKGKGMKDLGSLGGTTTASVNGLNERGEVVGGSSLAGDVINHPFLWDGHKLIDLVAPPFIVSGNGESNWINEAGEVVGLASLPTQCPGSQTNMVHAFLWKDGTTTDLGSVSGTSLSRADFINSQTQVVGGSWACDNSVFDGFLWENGSMVDLNDLLSEESPLHVFWALFINNEGVIGVFANTIDGDLHTALLIPCDENHPNIEGCDYSPVDESTTSATGAMQSAPSAGGVNTGLPPDLVRRLMSSPGLGTMMWRRGSRVQPHR